MQPPATAASRARIRVGARLDSSPASSPTERRDPSASGRALARRADAGTRRIARPPPRSVLPPSPRRRSGVRVAGAVQEPSQAQRGARPPRAGAPADREEAGAFGELHQVALVELNIESSSGCAARKTRASFSPIHEARTSSAKNSDAAARGRRSHRLESRSGRPAEARGRTRRRAL